MRYIRLRLFVLDAFRPAFGEAAAAPAPPREAAAAIVPPATFLPAFLAAAAPIAVLPIGGVREVVCRSGGGAPLIARGRCSFGWPCLGPNVAGPTPAATRGCLWRLTVAVMAVPAVTRAPPPAGMPTASGRCGAAAVGLCFAPPPRSSLLGLGEGFCVSRTNTSGKFALLPQPGLAATLGAVVLAARRCGSSVLCGGMAGTGRRGGEGEACARSPVSRRSPRHTACIPPSPSPRRPAPLVADRRGPPIGRKAMATMGLEESGGERGKRRSEISWCSTAGCCRGGGSRKAETAEQPQQS